MTAPTKDEILTRLDHIEHNLHFFAEAYKTLHNRLMLREENIKVQIDPTKHGLDKLQETRLELQDLLEEFKSDTLLGSLQFIAKKINEIQEDIKKIKNDGISKKIHLDLTMEGYEMVKRTPAMDELEMSKLEQYNADVAMEELLKTLTGRERQILMHRFGLLGEKQKLLGETGKIFGIGSEAVKVQEKKALRRLRHPERKHLVEQITHKKLKEAILGENT